MATYIRYNTFPSFVNQALTRRLAQPAYAPASVAVNVKEDETAFHLEVVAPGLNKNEFKVNVEGSKLTVAYQHETSDAEKTETFTRQEFTQTNFERSFKLPKNVNADLIQAAYTDGILKLDLPKVDLKTAEPKEIAVA